MKTLEIGEDKFVLLESFEDKYLLFDENNHKYLILFGAKTEGKVCMWKTSLYYNSLKQAIIDFYKSSF